MGLGEVFGNNCVSFAQGLKYLWHLCVKWIKSSGFEWYKSDNWYSLMGWRLYSFRGLLAVVVCYSQYYLWVGLSLVGRAVGTIRKHRMYFIISILLATNFSLTGLVTTSVTFWLSANSSCTLFTQSRNTLTLVKVSCAAHPSASPATLVKTP